MTYKIGQRVIAKTPVGTEKGTVKSIQVRYVVKLDKGLAFIIEESNIKEE